MSTDIAFTSLKIVVSRKAGREFDKRYVLENNILLQLSISTVKLCDQSTSLLLLLNSWNIITNGAVFLNRKICLKICLKLMIFIANHNRDKLATIWRSLIFCATEINFFCVQLSSTTDVIDRTIFFLAYWKGIINGLNYR